MQPWTVILGILFGTLFAIAFGLAVTLGIFWLLQGEHPRMSAELPELGRAVAMFTVLATCAGFSFYGSLRRVKWRFLAQLALACGIWLVGLYYWPDS
ncbi:MAG: hypothetical protein JJT85_01460 [Chromatiales bacterium]|nr:hypothetical protein [Chromatiales bacterium]